MVLGRHARAAGRNGLLADVGKWIHLDDVVVCREECRATYVRRVVRHLVQARLGGGILSAGVHHLLDGVSLVGSRPTRIPRSEHAAACRNAVLRGGCCAAGGARSLVGGRAVCRSSGRSGERRLGHRAKERVVVGLALGAYMNWPICVFLLRIPRLLSGWIRIAAAGWQLPTPTYRPNVTRGVGTRWARAVRGRALEQECHRSTPAVLS